MPIMASLAITCFGSAHHPLGVAALTLGEVGRAIDHFRQALAGDEALGHRPAHLLSRAALAEALRRRNEPGDEKEAAASAQAIEQTALAWGMDAWLPRWAAGGTRVPRADAPASCTQDGQAWRLSANGRTVRVVDGLGIRYLATLIANPDVEIPAAELAGTGALRNHHEAPISQVVLDEPARLAYRERLTEIESDLAEAETNADIERAARLRIEFEWLLAELGRTTGLGGRPRRFPTDPDRARTAVQKAIKRTLVRIGDQDPALRRDLEGSVVTGARCAYHPTSRGGPTSDR
jgi:hypothetical protein